MGSATLEIFDEAQAQTIDQIEAGQRVSGQIRFALQVPDLEIAMQRLLAHGPILVHPPITTPWDDYNVRLQDPDGLQIKLFQVMGNQEGTTATGVDATTVDATTVDATTVDATTVDATTVDATTVDATTVDATNPPPSQASD